MGERGHTVTILEATGEAGGQVNLLVRRLPALHDPTVAPAAVIAFQSSGRSSIDAGK